jgi:hypothetical protein
MKDYYVYVYIDPRNYEEFYYGKGKGSRKDAHLNDTSDSAKAKRILDIKIETGMITFNLDSSPQGKDRDGVMQCLDSIPAMLLWLI